MQGICIFINIDYNPLEQFRLRSRGIYHLHAIAVWYYRDQTSKYLCLLFPVESITLYIMKLEVHCRSCRQSRVPQHIVQQVWFVNFSTRYSWMILPSRVTHNSYSKKSKGYRPKLPRIMIKGPRNGRSQG